MKLVEKKSELSKELLETRREIREAKAYLREQQSIVDDAVSGWNAELVSFKEEMEHLKSKRDALLVEVSHLEEKRESLVSKNEALDDLYNSKVSQYKERLQKMV